MGRTSAAFGFFFSQTFWQMMTGIIEFPHILHREESFHPNLFLNPQQAKVWYCHVYQITQNTQINANRVGKVDVVCMRAEVTDDLFLQRIHPFSGLSSKLICSLACLLACFPHQQRIIQGPRKQSRWSAAFFLVRGRWLSL